MYDLLSSHHYVYIGDWELVVAVTSYCLPLLTSEHALRTLEYDYHLESHGTCINALFRYSSTYVARGKIASHSPTPLWEFKNNTYFLSFLC